MLTAWYRRYVLGALTLVLTLNYVDRALMVLLLQPIKQDLHLSDTELGLLTGMAFGLFYATLGLPVARWSDRGDRVTITAAAIGLWGMTVMSSLLVTNFAQMMAARVAAAVGEAGCMPPTYSLVGDYFPASADRTRAMGVYMLAGPLAALVSFVIGGWLEEQHGWRMAFFWMGLPGLLAALLVRFTVREPRVSQGNVRGSTAHLPRMSSVIQILWKGRSTRHLIYGLVLLYTMWLGMSPWYAAFLVRSHDMSTAELGMSLGLIFGFGGIAGMLIGSHVGSRWFRENDRIQLRVSALMIAMVFPCFVSFLLIPERRWALCSLVPLVIAGNFIFGPTFSLLQRLVRDEMRATTVAIVMLLANLIGMGIGPQLVGVFSDCLAPVAGRDSLRYAMLILSIIALWAAYHFWKAARSITSDLSMMKDYVVETMGPSAACSPTSTSAEYRVS